MSRRKVVLSDAICDNCLCEAPCACPSADNIGEPFSICEECQGHKVKGEKRPVFDWSGERYPPCNCKEKSQ